MNEEFNTFTIINDEGKEVECEVLFTFENEARVRVTSFIRITA